MPVRLNCGSAEFFLCWVRPGETSLSVQFARQMLVLCPFWQSQVQKNISPVTRNHEIWNNCSGNLIAGFWPIHPFGFTTTLPTSMAPWLVFQLQGLAIGWVDTTGRNWSLLDFQVRQLQRPLKVPSHLPVRVLFDNPKSYGVFGYPLSSMKSTRWKIQVCLLYMCVCVWYTICEVGTFPCSMGYYVCAMYI